MRPRDDVAVGGLSCARSIASASCRDACVVDQATHLVFRCSQRRSLEGQTRGRQRSSGHRAPSTHDRRRYLVLGCLVSSAPAGSTACVWWGVQMCTRGRGDDRGNSLCRCGRGQRRAFVRFEGFATMGQELGGLHHGTTVDARVNVGGRAG